MTYRKQAPRIKSKNRVGQQQTQGTEPDSIFLMKLVLYCVLGSLWLRIGLPDITLPLPIGFMLGLLLTRHETLQIDRKFEYAVLLMAAFLGFWFVPGVYINL